MVYVVGIGPGNKEYILPKAIDTLKKSDIIIGFSRAVESLDFIENFKIKIKGFNDLIEFLNENREKNICIAASGDPCFYGITNYIKDNYHGNIEIIPGISSFQYMTARLNMPWQNAVLSSLHGREEDFVTRVKNSHISIWLTDKINSPETLCKKLYDERLNVKIYIGEHLSYEDEKISIGYPEELLNLLFSDLSVVVIENEIY